MPPPPPPAPPPIPKQPLGGSGGGKPCSLQPPPDRNALLSQIKKGTNLKKTVTNDRSQPLVNGNRTSSANSLNKRSTENKTNGPFPIIPPGGLFAQGIPKLRPTTPRSGDSSLLIQSIKSGNSASSLDHLRIGQLSGSRSQPPSPVSKPRMTTNVSTCETKSLEISSASSGNPNFPSDINIKGPAPTPPPASQKPVFRSNTKIESSIQSDSSVKHTTVKRSASQTNIGQRRIARPPPNVKPPPPPKSNPIAPPQSVPPPPPSKPPNIQRRQSFGTGEGHNSRFASNKLSVAANNCALKPAVKGIGPPPPPPPPRNNSAPNNLNQIPTSSPGNQWKMNIAPPPPPVRAVVTNNKSAPFRPPPPRAPAPAPPPPPPQHQFSAHPAPPSQMKVTPSNMAPLPPTRISSIKQPFDFEERFKSMFCQVQSLPRPEKFMNFQKTYPSKSIRLKQGNRAPPPPPPQSRTNESDANAGRSQPTLHIRLESGILNSVARC